MTRTQRAERTCAAFGEALMALLAERPADQITADDIAAKAGMGRATWFRNCAGKEDAVASALVARWHRWVEADGVTIQAESPLLPFLRYVYRERGAIALLYERGMRTAVLEAAVRIAESLPAGGGSGYRGKFMLHGVVGLIDEWAARGFGESPEEVLVALGDPFGHAAT